MLRLRYSCVIITALQLTICNSYTISIIDSASREKQNVPLIVKLTGNHDNLHLRDGLRAGNIFENFITAMLDLLTNNFPNRKLRKYMQIVHTELLKLEYKHTKKLASQFRELSKNDGDEIKVELSGYWEELKRKPPHVAKFLNAIEAAFTMVQGVKFNDYIYDIRDYGNKDKSEMEITKETNSILRMIVEAVTKLGRQDLKELNKILKKALKKEHTNVNTLSYSIHLNLLQSTPWWWV